MDSEPVWAVSTKKTSGTGVTLKQIPPAVSPAQTAKTSSKYKRSPPTSTPKQVSGVAGEAVEEHEVMTLIYI